MGLYKRMLIASLIALEFSMVKPIYSVTENSNLPEYNNPQTETQQGTKLLVNIESKIKLTPEEEFNLQPFRKNEVEKLKDPAYYAKVGNTSAYTQLRTKFDVEKLKALLSKLKIGGELHGKILLFGGYVNRYGESLRDLGYNVIFTDLLPEWIEEARKKGFESYQVKAEDIPIELQKDLDFYTTFECYGPLIKDSDSLKIILEAVGEKKWGLVFIENEKCLNNPEYNHHNLLLCSLNKIKNLPN